MNIRWLNKNSEAFLKKDYLLSGQTVQERIRIIGDYAQKVLTDSAKENYYDFSSFSDQLVEYVSKGWISFSTPIWTNFGTNRGLSISCFNSHFSDSVSSILETNAEIGIMTKLGGGTSGYFGDIRGRGSLIKDNGSSNGTYPFLAYTQATTSVISQGSTRRGYFAGYIDIYHLDIEEWLNIRKEGDVIQHVTWGVCVPSWWLNEMREGDEKKRELWARVITKKFETGLPYIFYTDNANNGESVPDIYKGRIKSSNLCTEIMEPSDENESFVCDLASLNDLYYDEWKDTNCVEVVTFLLDAAMTEFIDKASQYKFMEKAVRFAKRHRAIGIGRLGYHSLLKSKMIPFESLEARNINILIQKNIQEQSILASKKLAYIFGECEETKRLGRRNTVLQAIAPTTSSAFIMQVSQSIEADMSNLMIKDLAKGKFTIKDKYLVSLLDSKKKNTDEVWEDILKHNGSVLHLEFLTDEEKAVFKTAREISQEEVILQASHRQKFIDQGQSLNLFITADTTAKEVNKLLLLAHDKGLKSLYYQHNVSAASTFAKKFQNCASCE